MPAVHLVRHGQASFGTADYDVLSDPGHRQAAITAKALTARGIQATARACGTLRRQMDTAAAFDGPFAQDPRWNEYELDHLLESSHGEIDSNRAVQAQLDATLLAWAHAADGFATWQDGALAALDDLLDAAGRGGTGLAVTSGGVIAAVTASLLGLGPAGFVALNRVSINASVTTVVRGRAGTTLLSFNEHGHLPAADVTYR